MTHSMKIAAAAALALALSPGLAAAQVVAPSGLHALDDMDVRGADGREIGEVDEVLIDSTGQVVAVAVEIDAGWLDLGGEDVVIQMSDLTFRDGVLVTGLTEAQVEAMPRWDD